MRMLAWVNLLQTDGLVNRMIEFLHLGNGTRNWLDGDWPTVVMGLIYGYVPFFILPLYAALERLDFRLLEASRRPRRVVVLDVHEGDPAAVCPRADGRFRDRRAADVRRLLHEHVSHRRFAVNGDGRQPDRVDRRGTSQPQTGASLVVVLMVFLMVAMAYYLITIARSQR